MSIGAPTGLSNTAIAVVAPNATGPPSSALDWRRDSNRTQPREKPGLRLGKMQAHALASPALPLCAKAAAMQVTQDVATTRIVRRARS